jgi:hypothetical protein
MLKSAKCGEVFVPRQVLIRVDLLLFNLKIYDIDVFLKILREKLIA